LRRPRRDQVRIYIQKCRQEWTQDTDTSAGLVREQGKRRKLCNKTFNRIWHLLHMKFKSNSLQIFLRFITFFSVVFFRIRVVFLNQWMGYWLTLAYLHQPANSSLCYILYAYYHNWKNYYLQPQPFFYFFISF
jgi:hypothetical protein